ncbi:KGGVGR-motif variant AAA ATPase [Burkholderia gladioli]
MAQFIHFDEARLAAVAAIREWLTATANVEALLVTDLFGKMRLVIFPRGDVELLEEQLQEACGPWWSGDVLQAEALDEVTRKIFSDARQDAHPDEEQPRLQLLERHRSRTAWFSGPVNPPWSAPNDGPPIVVFYSFKGGLGRSTLLASFAIQRARAGQRVCVIDMDLDSPGAGRLLSADRDGLMAQWGVVDFLIEHRLPDLRFDEYWHRCDRVAAEGEIRIMPSGKLDAQFADKLGRVDLEEPPSAHESGLWRLLERTRAELKPDWILLDARTGISEPAGQLLSGIAHLHVLLSTVQAQSREGLDLVVDRLGGDRVRAGKPQAELVLVQAMVPAGEPGKWAIETFAGAAETAFEDRYYADAEDDPDQFWTVNDKQSQDAPHVALPIDYDPRLASFSDIVDVADALTAGPYAEIGERIANRFVIEEGA